MKTYAMLKYAKFSAQKGRLVADLVRNCSVSKALDILSFSPKRAACAIKKVLESAIANAEHNQGADIDDLRISTIYVNTGPILKRSFARAKGRGDRRERRLCHITVYVSDKRQEDHK